MKETSPYKAQARENIILLSVVGSQARGLATENSDVDRMGVFIEPPEAVMGLHPIESLIDRPRAVGERSQTGDEEMILYSARKFAKLAAQGNPSVMELLFIEPEILTAWGVLLRANAHLFITKQCAARYMGYLTSQILRLQGKKGQKKVRRDELEAAYGFDVKYAASALLIGMQGVEILTTGRLTFPLEGENLQLLRDLRAGKGLTRDECVELADDYVEQIRKAERASFLREKPDPIEIDRMLVDLHTTYYSDRSGFCLGLV